MDCQRFVGSLKEILQHTTTHCNTLQHTARHCSTLQHTAAHCSTLQPTATDFNTLQHTATHYNTLQHTATHCHMGCEYMCCQRFMSSLRFAVSFTKEPYKYRSLVRKSLKSQVGAYGVAMISRLLKMIGLFCRI